MKRFIHVLFLAVTLFIVTAIPASAGWRDVIQENIINGGLVVIFAIIAGVFGKKWLAFKAPIQALLAVFAEYRKGKLIQSEEGEDLSKAEWNAIFAKMTLAVESIVAVIPAGWLPKQR